MSLELIIYGVVAAGLVVWLRSILGTRHGEERTRPNPYLAPAPQQDQNAPAPASGFEVKTVSALDEIKDLADNPTDIMSIEESAVDGLQSIARADKTFDVRDFLSKVQDAYAITLESFAEGDTETLEVLLDKSVFEAFSHEIIRREERNETMMTDVHAVRKAAITEAYMDGKMAKITVAFAAEETTVIRNADGEIISGDAYAVNTITNTWVFARNTKSTDPRWMVTETKG